MNRFLTTLLPLLALGATTSAQRTVEGVPATDWVKLDGAVPTYVFETPDVEQLKLEDEERKHRPLRYGQVLETHLDCEEVGRWDEAPDGSMVWRLRVSSPGAYSLGIVFDEFNLSAGEQVFLYDEERANVYGAYTEQNNQPNLQLGVQPFPGDTLVVEFVRQGFVGTAPELSIGSVTHDYRNVMNPTQFVGGSCLIGINCPQGANYQDEKRAVFRTLAGGALCSAALVNNTNDDGTPYFLTAEHCGNMTNGTFRFNYEQATCGTATGPSNQQISGATLLAASTQQDSQLYQLNFAPPSFYEPYFLGWNRSNSSLSGPVVTIGHGGGGPKNMAIDSNGASASGSNDWFVDWSDGYIIGGNSGGPLLDNQGRVIGPACCVNDFVCGSQVAWYGRFGRFWSTGNLAQWLAPSGSAPTTLDGHDPNGGGTGGGPFDLVSIAPTTIDALVPGTSKTVTLTGTGFTFATQVSINGTPLNAIPSPVEFVNSTTIRFDMPQLDTLGLATVTLTEGTDTDVALINVVAPATPKLQCGSGDAGNLVLAFAGLNVKWAGQPGDLHLFTYSTSNVPSLAPGTLNLLLGNNFTNVQIAGLYPVPAKGWDELTVPLTSAGVFLDVYSQSINLGSSVPLSFPLDASNFQSFQIL